MPTKNTIENRIYSQTHLSRVNQGPWDNYGSSTESVSLASSFTGIQNPSWWQQVRYGQNATTIASGTKDTMIVKPFLASVSFQAPGQLVDRIVQGDPHAFDLPSAPGLGTFPGLSDSVANAVLTRFLLKCRSTQRNLQGGVVLGELRKTIQLIRNPLKALDNAIHEYVAAVRGKSRQLSPRLIPRMLTEEYLSFTYGATPLMHDIKGAYEACIRLRDLPELVRVRAFAYEERLSSHSSSQVSYFSIPCLREETRYGRCEARIIGAVKVKSVGPAPPLKEAFGFQLRDFIPTIYELIPYSFLLDYFVGLGDFINAVSFCQADLAWHCRTTRYIGVSNRSEVPVRPNSIFGYPVLGYSFLPSQAQRSTKSFSRDAAPLGLPSVVFKLPSTGQGVNIAALAAIRAL